MMDRLILKGTAAGQPLPANPPRKARPEAARGPEFWTIPGLCWNARVTTSFGDLPVQALRLRDPLRTANGSFAQIQWIDHIKLDEDFLRGYPDAQPVLIQAGALGRNRPKQDIRVSPHQRIGMTESAMAPDFRMARDLTGRPGVMRRPETSLSYFLFHCGSPVTVMIEGVWVSIAP